MKPNTPYEKALATSLIFLSFRPRSEKEVRDNLLKKSFVKNSAPKYSGEVIEQVIDFLKKQKFVNDKEFIAWWIEQRTKVKPRSSRIIKMELKNKGINVAELSLEDLGDENMASRLLEKKMKALSRIPQEKRFEKAFSLLARNGFDYDTIKDTLKKFNLTKKY